jgi:hypothetical protein
MLRCSSAGNEKTNIFVALYFSGQEKSFFRSSVCNILALCCDTQKTTSFYTDAQNLHRTDKRLVLKQVDITAYEYSETYPDFGGTNVYFHLLECHPAVSSLREIE